MYLETAVFTSNLSFEDGCSPNQVKLSPLSLCFLFERLTCDTRKGISLVKAGMFQRFPNLHVHQNPLKSFLEKLGGHILGQWIRISRASAGLPPRHWLLSCKNSSGDFEDNFVANHVVLCWESCLSNLLIWGTRILKSTY